MSPRLAVFLLAASLLSCQPDSTVQPKENRVPVASIGGPYAGDEGGFITFDAKASRDSDGQGLMFDWDFGDGTHWFDLSSKVVHVYRDDGSYHVTLIVSDAIGAADTATTTVNVANVPPVITAVRIPPTAVGGGIPARVEVQYSDPGVDDTLHAMIYWMRPGGASEGDGVLGPGFVEHTFHDPGEYIVRLHVRDDDGGMADGAAEHPLVVVGRYEIWDLGTLSGNISVPTALNDQGQVVGYSTTSDNTERAFLWQNGSMRDLQISSGWNHAEVITNSGLVGGVAVIPGVGMPAFKWSSGTVTILGSVNDPKVAGITSARVLISTRDDEHGPMSGVWEDGTLQLLRGLKSPFSVATAMNSRGQIVGGSPVDAVGGDKIYHPFVWEAGVMRDLGLLEDFACSDKPGANCGFAWAVDINSSGDIVGYGSGGALLWPQGGNVRSLGPGRAVAINDAGNIAGWDYESPGFFWSQGTRTSLPTLGSNEATVVDLNDRDMVLGYGKTAESKYHVFVWTPASGTVDLGAGYMGDQATAVAINAHGDVIGFTCTNTCPWPGDGSRATLWRLKP